MKFSTVAALLLALPAVGAFTPNKAAFRTSTNLFAEVATAETKVCGSFNVLIVTIFIVEQNMSDVPLQRPHIAAIKDVLVTCNHIDSIIRS
jgi:hypothetical protein